MAIRVQLPNGEIGEFPDDMSHEDIGSVLQKQFPPTQENETEESPERTGLFGIMSDVGHGIGGAIQGAAKFAADTPQMVDDLKEQLRKNPDLEAVRGVGQVGAEAANIGKDLFNAPYNLNQYLARKHLLPQILDKFVTPILEKGGKLIPHIPEDTGLETALGLTPRKGDRLLRGVTDAASLVAGGVPVTKGIKNIATAPSKQRAFLRALESKLDKVAEEKGLAKGDLDKLKQSLTDEYTKLHPSRPGELTPIGQQSEINIKKQKLEANPKKDEIPEGELPKIPEKPDTKTMLEEHQKAIDEAKEAAEKGLDILDNPSIKAGGKIKNAIENLKGKASGLYKEARNHYVDKKIMADNSKEIKAVTDDLNALKDADELAPGYGSGTAEQKALESHLEALKTEKVNASDIFDLQRTLEKMAENARQKQFASGKGTTDLERKRYGELAERFDNHADSLAKRLEAIGGKDIQKIITEANKGWRTYKQLTKDNPVGKAAMKGNVPSQSLIKLAEDHPANDFLKGLVNSDPELRKHLLAAYSGEKDVNKLLNPSTVIKNYVESLPEVEEKLNTFKNAVSDYKAGEKSANKINKAHDDLVKSMKDVAEAKQLQQQIKFHEEAIPKIKAKMDKLDAKSAEHAKLEKEIQAHKNHITDKNYRLNKYGKYVAGYVIGKEVANKIGF